MWHYRVHSSLIDIRDPNGFSHKADRRILEAYIRGYSDVEVKPSNVLKFLEEVVLCEPDNPRFVEDEYVTLSVDDEVYMGRVWCLNPDLPRFVSIRWFNNESPWPQFWWDSWSLKKGYPSALHALAACLED